MRFVGLAIILLLFPGFVAWLRSQPQQRHHALTALALMLFLTGQLQIDAAFVSWRLWQGTARGLLVSPVDMLALALVVTRRSGLKGLPFLPVIGLYGALMLLSIVISAVPMASAFSVFDLLRVVLLFVAIGGEMTRPRSLPSLLTGLSIGLLIQAGYVISQKLSGVVQAAGTMPHQNILGMVTELATIPLLAAVLEGDRRPLTSAGVIAGLIIVAGGGSRATMGILGGFLVILVLLSLARQTSARKMKVLGIGIVAMAAIVPFGFATLKERFGDQTFVTEEAQRAAFEQAARAISADHPFGVGANLFATVNNTQGYAARAGLAWNAGNRSAPVHNAYLLARAETGRAGEIAFGLLFLIPAIAGIAFAFGDRRGPLPGIALGSGVAIAAVALHNFYEYAIHTYNPLALLMVDIAIIAGLIRAKRLSAKMKKPAPKPADAALGSSSPSAAHMSAAPGNAGARAPQGRDQQGGTPWQR